VTKRPVALTAALLLGASPGRPARSTLIRSVLGAALAGTGSAVAPTATASATVASEAFRVTV
jgi:hypothetical protein